MGRKKRKDVTITDVAAEAGVSIATVSRYINNIGIPPAATRAAVASAMQKLGYKNGPFSKGNGNGRRLSIAVVIPDMLNPFFSALLNGVCGQAQRHNVPVEIFVSDNSLAMEKRILENIAVCGAEGLIIVPAGNTLPSLKRLSKAVGAVVFADRTVPGAENWVISDDLDGAYQATKYLINLNHKDILFVGGKRMLSTERDRLAGFKQALIDNGIRPRRELIIEIAFNAESAYKTVSRLLRDGVRFSAVLAGDDLIAIGARKALEEKGIPIPSGTSLMSYGNMLVTKYMSLSTISTPAHEIGKNAFLMVSDLLHRRVEAPQRIQLLPSLIIRSSCGFYSKG